MFSDYLFACQLFRYVVIVVLCNPVTILITKKVVRKVVILTELVSTRGIGVCLTSRDGLILVILSNTLSLSFSE